MYSYEEQNSAWRVMAANYVVVQRGFLFFVHMWLKLFY